MEKHEINMAIQIAALEYVVTVLGAIVVVATKADTQGMREAARAKFENWTVPGLKEGWSDHLADEMQQAVGSLLSGIEGLSDRYRQSTSQAPPTP